ncbi:hypothetical protein, partial [Nocardia farcinica]|uniref:hypothetical protein n=1 Tax=Nocardia farcinica TaxID=37329 RepID=UPI002459027D
MSDQFGHRPRRRPRRARAPRPTVAQRLAAVDRLLDGEVSDAGGVWSRATAWILRLALEQAVDDLWRRVAPDLVRCPMRAQLLALRVYATPATAARVGALGGGGGGGRAGRPATTQPPPQRRRGPARRRAPRPAAPRGAHPHRARTAR